MKLALAAVVTLLSAAGPLAMAGESPSTMRAALLRLPFDAPILADPVGAGAVAGKGRAAATRDEWRPEEEVSWRSGALGLGLREEDGRIKGGPYLEAGSWRLDLRPHTDANVLDIDGVTLRLSTRFGD